MVASYEQLKNKQTELIRKALEGSAYIANVTAPAITTLTEYSASATAGQIDAPTAAVNIATGGNLVLNIKGTVYTVALAAADAPASQVTKINAVISAVGTASLVGSNLRIVTIDTGSDATIKVVSGTGTVLANTGFVKGQAGFGKDAGVNLKPLPAGFDDMGWLSSDGVGFARDVATSDVTSWGSVTPTRSDVTSDTSTMTVVAQETKLLTIGMATGADLAGITADSQTGEVSIAKPSRPASRHYRALSVAVDLGDGGEIYVARFLPRAKVTNYAEQNFSGGDDPITWGVTLTGEEDSALGYSERWLFGGAGWQYLLADMGF